MRIGGGGGDRDLALTAALAAIAFAVLVLPLSHWLQAVLALPLLLVLPGYALGAAIFPPGFITREERWVFTITFSIVAVVLGGLVLQLFVDLDRGVWIALLPTLTLGSCAVAFVRRGPRRHTRGRPIVLSPSLTAALLAAAAICAVAVAVASDGAGEQLARSHFSTIWVLPTDKSEEELEVNVENHEGRTVHYTVRVGSLQRVEQEWTFVLPSGGSWSERMPSSSFGLATFAALYRGETLFRRVSYQPRVVR
jgi:hypothetical protein